MSSLYVFNESFTNGYRGELLDFISLTAILCGIFVIISKNPIVSVLFLIGLFLSISGYLIMLGLNFIGLSYLLVYVGAVNKRVWNKLVAALVKIQLYKGLFILIKFFFPLNLFFVIFMPLPLLVHGARPRGNKNNNKKLRGVQKKGVRAPLSNYSNANKIGNCALSNPKFYLNKSTGLSHWRAGSRFYSTVHSSNREDEEFYKWFVGLADGESNFTIVLQKDKDGNIIGASFRFSIELHLDDLDALKYIKSKLNIGNNIAVYGNSCKFTVLHKKDINILISIFDKYNLNTSKYLDYLDFKKAFNLYYENDSIDKRTLIDQLLKLKNGMNNSRIDFNFPSSHKIIISDSWLLGLIEGEGSFYLDRTKLQPVFTIVLTKVQLLACAVIEKINEYLINNLGFDKYSKFKLQNSSAIAIVENKERNNSKPLARLVISNTNILTNYLVPYLENLTFLTKKGQDFRDFKIICRAVYNGAHRQEQIKSLILKLSYTMNNYRLSSNSDTKKVSSLSKEELDIILNAKPTIIHLGDGRQLDNITRKGVNRRWTNCVYEIVKSSGEVNLASTLNEAAEILNVEFRTVGRHLDSLSEQSYLRGDFVKIKGECAPQVRRVAVFYR